MKVEIYGCDNGATLETVELPVSEIPAFVNLVKAFGFEDSDGEEYQFNSAKNLRRWVCCLCSPLKQTVGKPLEEYVRSNNRHENNRQ